MSTPEQDPELARLKAEQLATAYQASVMSLLMGILKQGKVPTYQDITQTQETIDLPPHENQNRTHLN